MNSIVKSDVFFFISSISVIVLTVLILALIIYFFRIARDLKSLVSKVKEEGEEIIKDVKITRLKFEEKGNKFADIIGNFFKKKSGRKTGGSHTKENPEKNPRKDNEKNTDK